ncbi:Structural maintenance of chromosomes protein 5 [Ceratobasidium sp. 370]|nr:Structural maintenance of chromosomes protein 5 [Ceratobasidium sp. 370]
MAPRRGRVAIPEESDEDEVAVPTQQTADGAEEYEEDDGGQQNEVDVDRDVAASDEDAPSRKRTRVSNEGAAMDVEPKNEPVPEVAPRVTLPRDPADGFIPGAIVGIRLHNFLTYDDVDFRCGPHLNMLIGANGTGKSSIAGAIAIGLGGSPNILGRQSEIQGFVKNGKKDGFVEIELKGPAGERNLVIQRQLTTLNKGTKFLLNGESISNRDLKTKLEELNVQVTNLCAFLPQDKVSEFANMNPQMLLRETQRAAGTSHRERGEQYPVLENDKRELQHLEGQNAAMEGTIARYQRRRELEREIELLNLLLPFAQYNESKKLYDELKKRREAFRQMLDEATAKIQPIEQKKEEFVGLVRTADAARRKAAEKPRGVVDRIKRKHEEQDVVEKESEAVNQKRQELKNQEKSRKARLAKLKTDVTRLEKIVEKEPDVGDTAGVAEQRSELQRNYRAKMDEYRLLQDEQRQITSEIAQRKEQVATAQRGLQALNSVANQRMSSLRKNDPDVADVVEWLSKNQAMFRQEIIMPAWISVFVKDPKYQSQVENLFNLGNLKTFVCQNDEDYRKMNKLVNDEGVIGRKVRMNIWYRPPSQTQPPVPPEDLPKLGFNCYAFDCVQAPEGMRSYLEKELNLNRIALSLHENADVVSMTNAVTAQGAGSFITGTVMHQVTRSAYGLRLAQNSTRKIQNARLFAGNQVDTERQKQLEQEIVTARAQIDAEEAKMAEVNQRDQPMRGAITEIEEKLNEIKDKMTKIQNAKKQHEMNKVKLENAQKALQKEENAPDLKDEEEKLKKKLLKHALKRASLIHELKRAQGDPPPVTEVENDLATKQAELELNQPMNHELVRQYENRALQITALRSKVETQEKKTTKLNSRVERTKNKWKPALEELVSQISRKFSAAFDRIRRAGEIHIRDAGDNYADWAIDIMVKFRETEKLQVLDAHRQSGGERSLSTIMYLLSLTEYARIPFSLVDEINQGMDASAERDVHNQLVEVTCNTDCGQYFLITPKLLTGLHYHEKMKVLCVNNGDWIMHPETPMAGAGNLMNLVNNYARRVAASA